jgi:transcription termination factor NusB
MQIHQRINSRKLLLSYLYQYCFFSKLVASTEYATGKVEVPQIEQKDPFFDQDFLDSLQQLWESSAKEGEHFQEKLTEMLSDPMEDEVPYYLKHFFDRWTDEDLDAEYLLKVGAKFPLYVTEVQALVDQYTETFSYAQMDVVDQAIFLLGYTEWKVLSTPREILINEMIELAKRYSDDGAPKLINAVFDKMI